MSKTNVRQELQEILDQLTAIKDTDENGVILVRDASLKKRLAKIFLDLLREGEEDIENIAYMITTFIQFSFQDALDDVTSIAGDLELPDEHRLHSEEDAKKLIESLLEEYIQ